MNWSKTKSILIIALLITNAVMLWYLYTQKRLQDNHSISDAMVYQDVLTVLKDRNIQVAFKGIPKTEGIQAVEASYQTYDLEALVPRFLIGESTLNSEGTEAHTPQGNLRIIDGIRLVYENRDLDESSNPPAEEEALDMARKFLSAHGYQVDENTILSSVRVVGKDIEVVFNQQTSHRLIENGVMRLVVADQGIKSFERTWLRILKVREMTYEVIPPGRALLKLSETIPDEPTAAQPVVITGMTLGYKLDTDALIADVLSGDLSPYWRFTTRNGITYSIEALQ